MISTASYPGSGDGVQIGSSFEASRKVICTSFVSWAVLDEVPGGQLPRWPPRLQQFGKGVGHFEQQ